MDKDGYMSKEDFELMAKKLNELSNATGEQAESRRKAFTHCADISSLHQEWKLPEKTQ